MVGVPVRPLERTCTYRQQKYSNFRRMQAATGNFLCRFSKIYNPFFIEDDLALAYEIDLFLGKSAGPMATGFLFFRGNKYLRR